MFPPEVPSSLTITDIFLASVFIPAIISVAILYRKTRTEKYYKFFIPGLTVKLIASCLFCLVYLYYYGGGDTVYYFYSAKVLANLFFKSPLIFFKILFTGELSPETFSYFNNQTGWLVYANDTFSFFLVRLIAPLVFFSLGSFLTCSLLLASITYLCTWKLFSTLSRAYPSLCVEISIAILFIPSAVFWCSGILKDSITVPSLALCTASLFGIIEKKKRMRNTISLVIFSYLILSLKPYLLYAFLTSVTVWLISFYSAKFNITALKLVFFPLILALVSFFGFVVLIQTGEDMGKFSLDKMEELSEFAHQDLKRPEYGGHAFDIGISEKSLSAKIKHAPKAIIAALFRPYLWEAGNITMFFSAVENLLIIALTVIAITTFRNTAALQIIFREPFVLFCLFFVIIYSFAIGISISNFGTLVRFKSPMLLFFVIALLFCISWKKLEAEQMRKRGMAKGIKGNSKN